MGNVREEWVPVRLLPCQIAALFDAGEAILEEESGEEREVLRHALRRLESVLDDVARLDRVEAESSGSVAVGEVAPCV